MTRESLIEKVLWSIITSLIGIAVHYIGNISKNIEQLNEKLAVVIARVEFHEIRLSKLENYDGHGIMPQASKNKRP